MGEEGVKINRRDFLNSAVASAAVLAAGPLFQVIAKDESSTAAASKIYVCGICGHVEFGGAPEKCPVCHAPKEKFSLNNSLFSDALLKFKDKEMSHTPVITVKKESSFVSDLPCKEASVRVGKTMHPMEEAHHIGYIDWYMNDKFVNRIFTPLSLYPAVSIYIKTPGSRIRTVSWCNLHGYWQAEADL